MLAGGRPCAVSAVNIIGLRRAGFKKNDIEKIRNYYKIIFKKGLNTSQAIDALEKEPNENNLVKIIEFIKSSERGMCIAAGIKDRA